MKYEMQTKAKKRDKNMQRNSI